MEAHIRILFIRKSVAKKRRSIHEIVKSLSQPPSRVLEKGVKPKIGVVPKTDFIVYEAKPRSVNVNYVELEFNSLLKRVMALKPELDKVLGKYETRLSIGLYTKGQVNPGVRLNAKAVQFLEKFGGDFDVDIYAIK